MGEIDTDFGNTNRRSAIHNNYNIYDNYNCPQKTIRDAHLDSPRQAPLLVETPHMRNAELAVQIPGSEQVGDRGGGLRGDERCSTWHTAAKDVRVTTARTGGLNVNEASGELYPDGGTHEQAAVVRECRRRGHVPVVHKEGLLRGAVPSATRRRLVLKYEPRDLTESREGFEDGLLRA